jgi:hypothetical protein
LRRNSHNHCDKTHGATFRFPASPHLDIDGITQQRTNRTVSCRQYRD